MRQRAGDPPLWASGVLQSITFSTPDVCWPWKGDRTMQGRPCYGRATDGFSTVATHRVWFLFNGVVLPAHLDLHHVCENSSCVNPWHLRPLTAEEHKHEHRSKGPKEYCPQGHKLDVENLGVYTRPDGRIRYECRACGRLRTERWKKARG